MGGEHRLHPHITLEVHFVLATIFVLAGHFLHTVIFLVPLLELLSLSFLFDSLLKLKLTSLRFRLLETFSLTLAHDRLGSPYCSPASNNDFVKGASVNILKNRYILFPIL
jgi:hypothetical protein